MTKKTAAYILSSMALLAAIACAKTTDNKDHGASVRAGTLRAKVASVYRYQFSEDKDSLGKCTTGNRVFNSLNDLCLALPNDQINGNCASKQRSDYFLKMCGQNNPNVASQPGAASQPNVASQPKMNSGSLDEKIPETGFEVKSIARGETIAEMVKVFFSGSSKPDPVRMETVCVSSLKDVKSANIQAGLVLLGNSQVLLTRDESAESQAVIPSLILKCDLTREDLSKVTSLDGMEVGRFVIQKGQSTQGWMVTSFANDLKKSAFAAITCSEKIVNSVGQRAINLKSGSAVLFMRDMKRTADEGTDLNNLTPLVLIECQ